jgi:hypothetical protein
VKARVVHFVFQFMVLDAVLGVKGITRNGGQNCGVLHYTFVSERLSSKIAILPKAIRIYYE